MIQCNIRFFFPEEITAGTQKYCKICRKRKLPLSNIIPINYTFENLSRQYFFSAVNFYNNMLLITILKWNLCVLITYVLTRIKFTENIIRDYKILLNQD